MAIERGSKVITRQFSLLPATESRTEAVSKLSVALTKATALANIYVRDMTRRLKTGELAVKQLKSESKKRARKLIYDEFKYSKMESPAFRRHPNPLHNRIKQAAFYRALSMTRQWVNRTHTLEKCAEGLQALFQTDVEASLRFLRGESLYGKPLSPFYEALTKDAFGQKQVMTNYFLNNHLKQVKNLLLESNDESLVEPLKASIEFLRGESDEARQIIARGITKIVFSFKEKKRGKYESVEGENLPSHLLAQFFKKLSIVTTREANVVLSRSKQVARLDGKIKSSETLEKRDRLLKRREKAIEAIRHCERRLCALLPELKAYPLPSKDDLDEFKTRRKQALEERKAEYLARLELNAMELVSNALGERLNELSEMESSRELLLPVFKPSFPRISIKSATFEGFLDYANTRIEYAVRSWLSKHFLVAAEDLLALLSEALERLKNDLPNRVRLPTARALTVQIQDAQYNYFPDYENLTAKIGLCKGETMEFKINDQKSVRSSDNKRKVISRIRELLQFDNVDVKLPTIALHAGKILLSLPFEIKTTNSSNRPYNPPLSRDEAVSVKVDLGLKHFAVASVQQEQCEGKRPSKEIARYFLGQRQLFDLVFVDGKFLPQKVNTYAPDGHLLVSNDKNPSNTMLTLRRVREELSRVQAQRSNYKNAHPGDFKRKYKYYRLRRQYKVLWRRVKHLNATIKTKTAQLIVEIANYHRAGHVYFEDLKWSSHSKKAQAGRYLSFMQVHWVHSQVQAQVVQRGSGIEGMDVRRTSAAYTSQRCSECGAIEYRDVEGGLVYLTRPLTKNEQKEKGFSRTNSRNGKLFTCRNVDAHPRKRVFRLDSDLNAARNIGP